MTAWQRFLGFNSVGALGIGVQLTTVGVLIHGAGVNAVAATVIGVTAAIAHNFVWHRHWTWSDRPIARGHVPRTFARFALSNGAVSFVGNLVLVSLLVGLTAVPPLVANMIAIAACGLINYGLADRVVFRGRHGTNALV